VIRILAAGVAAILPWPLKRAVYRLLGHDVDRTAHVGVTLLLVDHLVLGPGARIGHLNLIAVDRLVLDEGASIRQLNLIRHCDIVHLGDWAVIGGMNFVNGTGRDSKYLQGVERTPALYLGPHSCITYGHLLDTSDTIRLGPYAGLAGWRSQLLTHALDVHTAAQYTAPIEIGEYAMAATAVVMLPGAHLPPYSMLGANSLLNRRFDERYKLYGGTPAKEVADLDPDMDWYSREVGEIP
jgi:acetyltransferase-like isoleucine patch superfamily enzyme